MRIININIVILYILSITIFGISCQTTPNYNIFELFDLNPVNILNLFPVAHVTIFKEQITHLKSCYDAFNIAQMDNQQLLDNLDLKSFILNLLVS